MIQACMGGWCLKRLQCPHYTEAHRSSEPAERLCEPGRDGVLADATAASIARAHLPCAGSISDPNHAEAA